MLQQESSSQEHSTGLIWIKSVLLPLPSSKALKETLIMKTQKNLQELLRSQFENSRERPLKEKQLKTRSTTYTILLCSQVFVEGLLANTPLRQLKSCLLPDDSVQLCRGSEKENILHMHNGIYSVIKKNKAMLWQEKQMQQEIIILSKFRQSLKNNYMFSIMCGCVIYIDT